MKVSTYSSMDPQEVYDKLLMLVLGKTHFNPTQVLPWVLVTINPLKKVSHVLESNIAISMDPTHLILQPSESLLWS